jgi:hypothetical protein
MPKSISDGCVKRQRLAHAAFARFTGGAEKELFCPVVDANLGPCVNDLLLDCSPKAHICSWAWPPV